MMAYGDYITRLAPRQKMPRHTEDGQLGVRLPQVRELPQRREAGPAPNLGFINRSLRGQGPQLGFSGVCCEMSPQNETLDFDNKHVKCEDL